MKSKLFDFTFKNGIRIEVTEGGFSLWDAEAGRWVVDGTTLSTDGTFAVQDTRAEKWTRFDFSAFYPREKPTKKRNAGIKK